ncbi:MAG TPA: hypothetical protein P5560_10700 [Thermotogota bacterium]|nr:hypothetical protein [Thermotogota bacterium]HRW93406.1 hypothetical protein [Thermotogota bacterium]
MKRLRAVFLLFLLFLCVAPGFSECCDPDCAIPTKRTKPQLVPEVITKIPEGFPRDFALFQENFDAQNFSPRSWEWLSGGEIRLQDTVLYEGNAAMELAGGGMQVEIEVPVDSTLRFFRKTQISFCEPFYYQSLPCPLQLYVDDVLFGSWTGTTPWQEVVREIPAGKHTLRWTSCAPQGDGYSHARAWVDAIRVYAFVDREEKVCIPDPYLRELVLRSIGKASKMDFSYLPQEQTASSRALETSEGFPQCDQIFANQVRDLTHLESFGVYAFVDLTGIEALSGLQCLLFPGIRPISIAPLLGLQEIKRLQLGGALLEDLSGIKELDKLEVLCLEMNNVHDISDLANLQQLRFVNLWGNPVSDFSALENLPHLQWKLRTPGENGSVLAFPNVPKNSFPADGERIFTSPVTLCWNACFDQSGGQPFLYFLYLGKDSEELVLWHGGLTQNWYNCVAYLEPETTYYWNVEVRDWDFRLVTKGPTWSFSTGPLSVVARK